MIRKQVRTVLLIGLAAATAEKPGEKPGWFVPPPPSKAAWSARLPGASASGVISGPEDETITVIGTRHRAPIQPDPHAEHPADIERAYEAGASWGSTHPGQFCCATAYDTGMDGQAGR